MIASPPTEAPQPELVALRRGGLTICQRDLSRVSLPLRPFIRANEHVTNSAVVAVKTAADIDQGNIGSRTTI